MEINSVMENIKVINFSPTQLSSLLGSWFVLVAYILFLIFLFLTEG